MKKKLKKWLRPVLFTLGGALMGLGYYALVGCSTGSCAITASPVNTMLYMGLIGWLLSGIFGSQSSFRGGEGEAWHIAIEVHPLVNPGFAVRTLRVSQLVHAPLKPPN